MHPRIKQRLAENHLRPGTITAQAYAIIAAAAAEGLPAPSNEELADRTDTRNSDISKAIYRLKEAELIQIEWDGPTPTAGVKSQHIRRRFRVTETGEVTAWTVHGQRRQKGKERACMTCTAPFKSEGPHHRLCPKCNAWASSDGGHAGSTAERAPMLHHAPKVLPVSLPPIAAMPRTPCAREDLAAGRALQREIAERYLEGAEV